MAAEKKYSLPKDSLAKLVGIMEYIEEHDEMVSESQLKSLFGNNDFYLFSRYCLSGNEKYAEDFHGSFRLTQSGIRKLYELRGILADEKRAESLNKFNQILAFSAIFGVFYYILSYFGIGSFGNLLTLLKDAPTWLQVLKIFSIIIMYFFLIAILITSISIIMKFVFETFGQLLKTLRYLLIKMKELIGNLMNTAQHPVSIALIAIAVIVVTMPQASRNLWIDVGIILGSFIVLTVFNTLYFKWFKKK